MGRILGSTGYVAIDATGPDRYVITDTYSEGNLFACRTRLLEWAGRQAATGQAPWHCYPKDGSRPQRLAFLRKQGIRIAIAKMEPIGWATVTGPSARP
jgi:hypothetical protein